MHIAGPGSRQGEVEGEVGGRGEVVLMHTCLQSGMRFNHGGSQLRQGLPRPDINADASSLVLDACMQASC